MDKLIENDKKYGIALMRYCMSWVKVTKFGRGSSLGDFEKWIESLELDEDDSANIIAIYGTMTGKLELECHARCFINEKILKNQSK